MSRHSAICDSVLSIWLEELDRGDYFEYGWKGDEYEIMGRFNGVSEGASTLPEDETGTIVIALPDVAARSALRLFLE